MSFSPINLDAYLLHGLASNHQYAVALTGRGYPCWYDQQGSDKIRLYSLLLPRIFYMNSKYLSV